MRPVCMFNRARRKLKDSIGEIRSEIEIRSRKNKLLRETKHYHLMPEGQLQGLASQYKEAYQSAQPFPHIVIDDFLPPDIMDQAEAVFPGLEHDIWSRHFHEYAEKLASARVDLMPKPLRKILIFLNDPSFLSFLEDLTGIQKILADWEYNGGGLHRIQRGGYLNIHADFNIHPRLRLHRRLNLLLYLNKEWKEEYHGELELWDYTMSHCIRKIQPIFNRCVIFNTTDISFHGHPEPLACPATMARKSLATYYYTKTRPIHEMSKEHSTLYQERPG